MDKTIQTNVRVNEDDKPLIVALARRLRSEPGFRDRVAALLADGQDVLLAERIKKLEQQVSWLLSGAIVVPRTTPRTPGPAQPPR
jgi:hypothetical protein